MSYEHILATVEPDQPHAQTMFQASKLAARLGAKLTVLSVLPELGSLIGGSDTPRGEQMVRELSQNTRLKLEQVCQQNGIRGAVCEVLIGDPEDRIIDYAKSHRCDLIAVGTHNREFGDYLTGTTATSLLQHWMGDVLGVRKRLKKHTDSAVIAIDSTPTSRKILDRARQLIPERWEVKVIHVGKRAKQDALRELLEASQFSADDLVIVPGKPSTQIKQLVSSMNARLLVMGSGVHTGIGWLIGSTTYNVMIEMGCDTLIVRPDR